MHFSCMLMQVHDPSFTIQCNSAALMSGKIHMCFDEKNSPVPKDFPHKADIQAS